jgi:hypothetical protein
MSDDFDLSAASASALSHLEGQPAAAPAPTPAPAAAPEVPSPAPDGQAAQPEVATPKTYKVKVDGEEVEVPEDELLNGYSRTAKFTKTMMQLSDQRKAFEAERQQAIQREQALNEFFRDPANIARYYEHLTGKPLTPAQQAALQPAPVANPHADEFATVGTVEQMAAAKAAETANAMQRQMQQQIQRQLEATQKWTAEQIQRARVEAEQERKTVEYHGEITGTVGSLLEQFPVLKAVDDIENVLCFDAQRMDPSNLEEAKAALLNVAKARAEKLNAHFQEMQKQSAIERTKLSTQGIEPPGGTGVAPAPTQFKLGDKGLAAAAAEWLDKRGKK